MRKRLLGLLLAASMTPGVARAADDVITNAQLAEEASAAYDAEDYALAVETYGKLTWDGGSRDADVWYNAGNAHARAGQQGAAIAAYRAALALAPRHGDARANLAYLRDRVGVAPAGTEAGFLAWLLRPTAWIAAGWWRRLTAIAWVLLWSAAAVSRWRPRGWVRVTAAAGGVCVLCAAGWGAHLLGRSLEPRAIVVASEAPLRTGPGPDYLLTYTLPDGAECVLLTRHAGWAQLRLSDGATGWTEADRVWTLPLGDAGRGRVSRRGEDAP